jgi:hypothetical protein
MFIIAKKILPQRGVRSILDGQHFRADCDPEAQPCAD